MDLRWKKRLMDEGEINRAVNRMAHEIIERSDRLEEWCWWGFIREGSRWPSICRS